MTSFHPRLQQHSINLQIATDFALCLKPSAKILEVSLQLMLMLFFKKGLIFGSGESAVARGVLTGLGEVSAS